MNLTPFRLAPFPTGENIPELEINGTLGRQENLLALRYKLVGDMAGLILPGPAETPLRKDNLWQTTCFELFLTEKGATNYWEFNLSPAGHWNAYSFADYRRKMREESAYTSLPFTVDKAEGMLGIALKLQLGEILDKRKNLEAAVCAVIHSARNGLSYWALTHCGTQPDFHRRESFIITL